MNLNELIPLIVIAALVVIVALIVMRNRRSQQLRKHFGPEYERTVSQHGDKKQAEKELEMREKRVKSLDIRPLTPADRKRFEQEWYSVQTRFVDQPNQAVDEANRLVKKVMEVRGYPVGNFDQRAADISVDYPRVVENYRAARAITEKNARGEASTEDLRQALVYYRALFVELLETSDRRSKDERRKDEKEAVR